MEEQNKKIVKRESRRTVFGIKLPPISPCEENIKTIQNVDPNFYDLPDGRPIRPNTSLNKYKEDIKNLALKRAIRGFTEDEIMRIAREIETERNIFETASRHFEEYQHSFDKFLAYDNNKTIDIMKKSDNMAKELVNITEEHKDAHYELASIKSKLQYIDDSLLILLSFENFLHKASPILWQQKHDIKLDTKHSEIFIVDSDIFKAIDINKVKGKLHNLAPPRLYFETPEQLLEVFNLLENQNLNYLLMTEELKTEKSKFMKARDSFKKLLRKDLHFIERKIKETEEIIAWNEVRETELKEVFFKILQEKIRYLIASKTALQTFNYVEYAYEHIIALNDIDLSTLAMAQALENEYDNLMMYLSAFDLDITKTIEKETYQEEANALQQATIANKLLKDVNKLNRRLKSSYEPSRKKLD